MVVYFIQAGVGGPIKIGIDDVTAETAFGLNSGSGGVVYAHRPQRVDRTAAQSGNSGSRERQSQHRLAFAGRRPDTGCTPGGAP